MVTIPAKRQTVSMETGEVIAEDTVEWTMAPAPEGTCPVCGTEHDTDEPHNPISLRYQFLFHATHGRLPDWRDAMAHCSDRMQETWTRVLKEKGVDVAAGQVRPSQGRV